MPPSPAKASPRTPSSTAPCAWWRRPRPPCRSCSTRATRRSSSTRSSTSSPAPTPSPARRTSWSSWYGFLLVSGNAYLEAVALGGELARAVRAAPRPHEGDPRPRRLARGLRVHRRRPQPCAFPARWCPACARSCTSSSSTPSTTTTASPPSRPPPPPSTSTTPPPRWNKALLDNSARPSGALVYTARDGNLSPDQFDRLKTELEQGFQGAAHAGRPLLLGRRPRLEVDEPLAQGHGLHRSQAHRRPRDRPGPRRPTHAARHPRRQHLLQLPGGHPLPLAPNRPAASHPHRQSPLARGSRQPTAPLSSSDPTTTPSKP